MKKIKFGIVGLGSISNRHIAAIENFKEKALITDVCDTNLDSLRNFKNLNEGNKHSSFESILKKSKADYLVLATPNGLHSEQSLLSMQSGFNVITEKPMAINLKDSLSMIKASKDLNKKLFVIKQVRLLKRIKLLKKAVEEGHFGKIFLSHFNLFWSRPQSFFEEASWRGTKNLDGGMLYNQAIHYIDLMSWLLGPVESLYCNAGTLARKIECEDTAVINFKFKSGAYGSFNSTILTYPKNLECSFVILGEKGSVKIGGSALDDIKVWDFEDNFAKEEVYEDKENFNHTPFYNGVLDEENEGKIFPFKGEDSIETIKLIEAALTSAEEKKIINLG